MTELAAALVGAIFGSLAGGLVQHRLWLRGTRRDVYARFLTAHDLAMDAARSYIGVLKFVTEADSGGQEQDPSPAMLELCEDRWTKWQTRRHVLRDLGSELELVASRWSQLQVMLLNMRLWDVSPAHREDDVAAAAAHVLSRWDEAEEERKSDRQKFMSWARFELRVEAPLHERVRWRIRRFRGLWLTVKVKVERAFRRSEAR